MTDLRNKPLQLGAFITAAGVGVGRQDGVGDRQRATAGTMAGPNAARRRIGMVSPHRHMGEIELPGQSVQRTAPDRRGIGGQLRVDGGDIGIHIDIDCPTPVGSVNLRSKPATFEGKD